MKKIVSLVFLICILLGFSVFLSPVQASVIAEGTCGDNVTWVLDDTETLIISGDGKMYDYDYFSNAPWNDKGGYKELKSLIINDGVTHIGNYAFKK